MFAGGRLKQRLSGAFDHCRVSEGTNTLSLTHLCSCSNRHNCDHDIPPQVAGALGCNSARDIGTLASDESRIGHFVALRDLVSDCVSKLEVESGQSTVEYALVLSACLGVVVGLGLLMGSIEDGVFVEHAVAAASHNVEVLLGGTADVFSF